MSKPILRTSEVCELLGVSPRTLQYWRQKGIIKFSKIGRSIFYAEKDVRKLLEEYQCNQDEQKD